MAKRKLEVTDHGLHIQVTGLATKQAEFLKAVAECQEGRCSCPSDEYTKLASIKIELPDDAVNIELTAKPGETIDPKSIQRCLDHTLGTPETEPAAPSRAT